MYGVDVVLVCLLLLCLTVFASVVFLLGGPSSTSEPAYSMTANECRIVFCLFVGSGCIYACMQLLLWLLCDCCCVLLRVLPVCLCIG